MGNKTEEKLKSLIIVCMGFIVLIQGVCLMGQVLPDILKLALGFGIMIIGIGLEAYSYSKTYSSSG